MRVETTRRGSISFADTKNEFLMVEVSCIFTASNNDLLAGDSVVSDTR